MQFSFGIFKSRLLKINKCVLNSLRLHYFKLDHKKINLNWSYTKPRNIKINLVFLRPNILATCINFLIVCAFQLFIKQNGFRQFSKGMMLPYQHQKKGPFPQLWLMATFFCCCCKLFFSFPYIPLSTMNINVVST